MSSNWRELFARAVSGDILEPAEAAELDAALEIAENRDEAVAWLQFEATVSEHLRSTEDVLRNRSRERLLAKAILREKHRVVTRKIPERSLSGYRLVPVAAVVALLALGLMFFDPWPQDGNNQVQASGDYRVLGVEPVGRVSRPVERGDRLVTGAGGASLTLGEYCEFETASNCDLTIRGAPGNERIELHQGQLRARIQPQRGVFSLVTPLGPIEVKGTEFVTTVDYLDSSQGENSMNGQARQVVVKVAVLAGAVMCQLGDGPVVLQQGANRTFAGEKEDARGVVVAKTELSLTIKLASGEEVTFHAPESKALTVREVSQLNVGDEAGVIWIEEEGKKCIQDIIAKGVIEGVVTGLGDIWIEVKPEGKKAVRLIPPWLEATESRDGGLDREVLKKLGQTRVGDRVLVNWAMPEGQRVMDLKVLKPGRGEESERDVAKGVIDGVVTGLGDQWIEVAAEGQKPLRLIPPWRDGGLDREVLKKLGTARVGDRVLLSWEMLEGKRVVDMKVLQRANGEEGDRSVPDSPIPVGLRGFKGILFGKIAEKDNEKGTFTLHVQKVGRVWRQSEAKGAEEAVGKSLPVELHRESRLLGQHQETLRKLNNGDVVEVEVFHVEDGVLSVMELLRKSE